MQRSARFWIATENGTSAASNVLLERAEAEHADLAVFPESSIPGWVNPEAHQMAYPIPGADSYRIAELARKYKLMIAIGMGERGRSALRFGDPGRQGGAIRWRQPKINVAARVDESPTVEGRPEEMICADAFRDSKLRSRQATQTGSSAGALWLGSDERELAGPF